MSFKLETHLHTSEGSACGRITAEEQVRQYKTAGYDGILVTDHFINGNSAVDRSLLWKDQMDWQFRGYEKARAEGDKVGLKVFCGIEYAYNGTEFILIGLDKDWFIENKRVIWTKPKEFLKIFRDAGAAIIQVHPFRRASYINTFRFFPDDVDAIEVYNHGNHLNVWNDSAYYYAKQHNKPMTAGSDCHGLGEFGAGLLLDKEPSDASELASIIRSGSGWTIFGERYDESKFK